MVKIPKTQAKRRYESGEPFIIVACNLRPEFGIPVTGITLACREGISFTDFVNSYEYYNCHGGAGSRAAFYMDA